MLPGKPTGKALNFNPRSPCGERPNLVSFGVDSFGISIHAPRVGSDLVVQVLAFWIVNFNPRSPCGERLQRYTYSLRALRISIHAPRVGSDRPARCTAGPAWHFNPRSPCGERPSPDLLYFRQATFQSTLPVWGATQIPLELSGDLNISIHAPRVGSDDWFDWLESEAEISIHAPRVGSDRILNLVFHVLNDFNPRSPCGERPDQKKLLSDMVDISIHAPRVGSDGISD